MKALTYLTIVSLLVAQSPVNAGERFTTVAVSAVDNEGLPATIAFDAVGNVEPNADGFYNLDGQIYIPEFGGAQPITIFAPAEFASENMEQAMALVTGDILLSNFQAETYRIERDDLAITRVLLIGTNEAGAPTFVSVTDDPGPLLPLLVVVGVVVGYCAIMQATSMIKECPNGTDLEFSGSLTEISCSFSCKQ